ncbi:hypothetical protein G8Y85_04365 [Staphylococcus sp. 11007852]|uniref:hypothetical protein n=1 Tax=Staphylococcus TaxID=1279 RepID=UPI001402B016|nr:MULTISPECIES: hypothetical protein [Staphylococcus]NHM74652.1 hypothetical protein [Staphylococcus sp. 11007852]NJH84638.1 hypothetical protein [Staphylococcus agnetis]
MGNLMLREVAILLDGIIVAMLAIIANTLFNRNSFLAKVINSSISTFVITAISVIFFYVRSKSKAS